jgi:tRNA threonylcarbamoyladenosine biosynthesis protein TsaE
MRSPTEILRLQLGADPAATEQLGRLIGRRLRAGDTVALRGELGAGKTTLTRGLAEGLGVDDPAAVASPTYLLVIEHAGPVPLRHADAYLPGKLAAFLADGGVEYLFDARAVTVVEWADRIAEALPEQALWLELTLAPGGGRLAVFRCREPRDYPWVAQLAGTSQNRPGN